MPMYRVVLEKPYTGNPKGEVSFRYDTTPSQRIPGRANKDFLEIKDVDTGQPMSGVTERAGKPIVYGPLVYGDPKLQSQDNIPYGPIQHYFGDWTIPDVGRPGVRYHKGHERNRVAEAWGGYQRQERQVGKNWASYRVGPPAMPQVAIYEMDDRGNLKTNDDGSFWVYRPYEFFGFDSEVYDTVPQAQPQQVIIAGAAGTDHAALAAMQAEIAEMKLALQAKQAVETSMKRKPGRPRKIVAAK